MRSRISSTRQAVVRGPSFTGFGKRPVLTPSHQVDRATGIGPLGARMDDKRTKPATGSVDTICSRAAIFSFFTQDNPFTVWRRGEDDSRLKSSSPLVGSRRSGSERGGNPAGPAVHLPG